MRTCKDCLHNALCKDMVNFGIVDLPYENDIICDHFKDKANIIEPIDNPIIYVQDKWLVLNMESRDLGEAIKRILEFARGR